MKHWQYLKYVLRHKRYVLQGCRQLGIPWRGIKHDLSKFSPDEWFPYAEFFYGEYPQSKDEPRHGNPSPQVSMKFQSAWLKHIHRNPHHWQYWILHRDNGSTDVLFMPMDTAKEMLADWYGVSKALGAVDGWKAAYDWYQPRKDTIHLHPKTRKYVEANLKYLAHGGDYSEY